MSLAESSFCTGCGTPLEPAEAEPAATEHKDNPEPRSPMPADAEPAHTAERQGAPERPNPPTQPATAHVAAERTPMTPEQVVTAVRLSAWGTGLAGVLLCVGALSTWFSLTGADAKREIVPLSSMSSYRIIALLAGLGALACAIRLAATLRGDAALSSVIATHAFGWICLAVAAVDLVAGGVKVVDIAHGSNTDYASGKFADVTTYPSVTYIVAVAGAVALLAALVRLPMQAIRNPADIRNQANSAAATIAPDFEECPSCGEQIRAKARLCRFCRDEVEVR